MTSNKLLKLLSDLWSRIKAIWFLLGAELKIWRYERRLAPITNRLFESQEVLEDGWQTWQVIRSKAKKERLRRRLQKFELNVAECERELDELSAPLEKMKMLVRIFWQKVFASEKD